MSGQLMITNALLGAIFGLLVVSVPRIQEYLRIIAERVP